jgi:ABC-type bacteriocin/lantibiotic exporter with double-glycine peptidase domain
VVLTGTLLFPACGKEDPGAGATERVNLNIPDRWWDPVNTPDEGWCGEASIQMAMGYYGRQVSQVAIHQAANTTEPDITEVTMDAAFSTLGVSCTAWDESNPTVADFIAWIQDALRDGHPVICGMKIYPDENPQWYVDHFVLAVGFDEDGLILNTQLDCDGQLNISYDELASTQLAQQNYGYAFVGKQNRYFGRIVTAVR